MFFWTQAGVETQSDNLPKERKWRSIRDCFDCSILSRTKWTRRRIDNLIHTTASTHFHATNRLHCRLSQKEGFPPINL